MGTKKRLVGCPGEEVDGIDYEGIMIRSLRVTGLFNISVRKVTQNSSWWNWRCRTPVKRFHGMNRTLGSNPSTIKTMQNKPLYT